MLYTNEDIAGEVLQRCDAFSLLTSRGVCRAWRALASRETLWQRVLNDNGLLNSAPAWARSALEERAANLRRPELSAMDRFLAWCCAPLLHRASLPETIRVDQTCSLSDVVAGAHAGAVVLIEAGVYDMPGTLVVQKALTLVGRNRRDVVLRCSGTMATDGDLTLANLTISHPGAQFSKSPALMVQGGGTMRLLSCLLESNGPGLVCATQGSFVAEDSTVCAKQFCFRGAGSIDRCFLQASSESEVASVEEEHGHDGTGNQDDPAQAGEPRCFGVDWVGVEGGAPCAIRESIVEASGAAAAVRCGRGGCEVLDCHLRADSVGIWVRGASATSREGAESGKERRSERLGFKAAGLAKRRFALGKRSAKDYVGEEGVVGGAGELREGKGAGGGMVLVKGSRVAGCGGAAVQAGGGGRVQLEECDLRENVLALRVTGSAAPPVVSCWFAVNCKSILEMKFQGFHLRNSVTLYLTAFGAGRKVCITSLYFLQENLPRGESALRPCWYHWRISFVNRSAHFKPYRKMWPVRAP